MVILLFNKADLSEQTPLALQSVIVKPAIITSTDKNRDPICLLMSLENNHLFENTMIIRRKNSIKNFVETLFMQMIKPYAACTIDSVEE